MKHTVEMLSGKIPLKPTAYTRSPLLPFLVLKGLFFDGFDDLGEEVHGVGNSVSSDFDEVGNSGVEGFELFQGEVVFDCQADHLVQQSDLSPFPPLHPVPSLQKLHNCP